MEEISVEEARDLMYEENVVLLDVRSDEEYKHAHMPDALHINIHNDDFLERVAKLDKEKTYLVFCRTGGRSKAACEQMEKMGFCVYNVVGWILR